MLSSPHFFASYDGLLLLEKMRTGSSPVSYEELSKSCHEFLVETPAVVYNLTRSYVHYSFEEYKEAFNSINMCYKLLSMLIHFVSK